MRPQIVVANKCEMPNTEDSVKRLQDQITKESEKNKGTERQGLLDPKLYVISAVTGMGVDALNLAVASKVAEIKKAAQVEQEPQEQYDKVWTLDKKAEEKFEIKELSAGVFEVFGKRPVRAVVQTDLVMIM